MGILFFLIYVGFSLVVLYGAWPKVVWEVGSAVYLLSAALFVGFPWLIGLVLLAVIVSIVLINRIGALRNIISDWLFKRALKSVPTLSKTEQTALNAGDVWLEQGIFTGELDWERLATIKTALTAEEQSFLDNETETLCAMLNDWENTLAHDVPESAWQFMKEKGFFGLVIDKAYGGKGFSARGHSDIVMKISMRSPAAAVTVMVPNSLGPGELLQHYGTSAQKKQYLPRLAKGQEIPCFALTEPTAGSDATSIQSEAVVIEKKVQGKTVLGLKIKLNKRWITLSPVATLIGLAVQLKDPDGLLKGIGEEGITCLLIPRDTKNLEIGNRHLPAGLAFMNGTIRGDNIFASIDSIIGGQEKAGQGWKMLVECLSIGRSISLPALGAGASTVSYITSGAFARLRKQFNVEVAQFEGVQEKLAEIAGLNYLTNSTRFMTLAAVDAGIKPSVASAVTKYFNTELARTVITDGMDVQAGRTVVLGPRNYLASFYYATPMMITVEGANIMTRNLLIFGQGSMACHPYVRAEFDAIAAQDTQAFREIIWQHIYYFSRNFAKAVCSMVTGGYFISVPQSALKRDYQKLSRLSYAYAWIADLALISLGGSLKRKERLSARLADGMSYLYMAMAVLRNAQANNEHPDQLLHAKWAVTYCFYQAQHALIAFSRNFPNRLLGFAIRLLVFPLGQTMRYPNDALDCKLAQKMTDNNDYRDSLIKSMALTEDSEQPIERMEHALQLLLKNSDLYKKIKELRRCPVDDLPTKLQEKVEKKEISAQEKIIILAMEKARLDAMQVDEFSDASLKNKVFTSEKETASA